MRSTPFGLVRPVLAGLDPPISLLGPRQARVEHRMVSLRWLVGTVLTGASGTALIAVALFAAAGHRATVAQAPQIAVSARPDRVQATGGPARSDRLVRNADIVAEKQGFKAPTTVTVGDKQVVRLRAYTHLATTLTLVPTDQADKVPPFDALKLLGGDQQNGIPNLLQADDPGPQLDASEVSFTTGELATADAAAFAGELSKADAAAQVGEHARMINEAGGRATPALPPQFLLMRASRPSLDAASLLAFAGNEPITSPLAPFSAISVRMTPENVTLVPRSEPGHDGMAEKLVVVRHGATLDDILKTFGATGDQARAIVEAFGARRGEQPVAEGRRLRVVRAPAPDGTPGKVIVRLGVYADETLETTIAMADDGQYVRIDPINRADAAHRAPSADDDDEDDADGMRLYDSIYQTALKQQIPPAVIAAAIRTMSNDVDFQQRVQGGDSIDLFYADDEDNNGTPDLLFAAVTIRNETYRYYRFSVPDDPAPEYFDDAGRSMRKFLIRTPVTGGVFTSGFGIRFHPVLGYTRPHTGVDWAAPVGTPILAAGTGTVLKAEHSSSYGNHIEIQHANGYITTYSHMVGFARGMADGIKVRQGQVVGYLGQTGLATGPHLHYEVIVNGRFVDPMRVKLARSKDIVGPQLAEFKREHDRIDALMASAPNASPSEGAHASN